MVAKSGFSKLAETIKFFVIDTKGLKKRCSIEKAEELWELAMKELSPEDIHTAFIKGLPSVRGTMLFGREDLSNKAELKTFYQDSDGSKIGRFGCTFFDHQKEHHSFDALYVEEDFQGCGFAKRIVGNFARLSQKQGASITTLAEEIGSYAWGAKFRFRPVSSKEWAHLKEQIKERLDAIHRDLPHLDSSTLRLLNKALRSDNPKALWIITGLRDMIKPRGRVAALVGEDPIELGKILLIDLRWHGVLDTSDERIMARVNAYTSLSKREEQVIRKQSGGAVAIGI